MMIELPVEICEGDPGWMQRRTKNFDCYIATESGVTCAIYFSHATDKSHYDRSSYTLSNTETLSQSNVPTLLHDKRGGFLRRRYKRSGKPRASQGTIAGTVLALHNSHKELNY
jgi:hypothetical protein